jgi:hypothetical protein
MSEMLGMTVPPGSTVSGLSAGIAATFMQRMDVLRDRGLWSDELQRRLDAVEALPDDASEHETRMAVDALLFEVTRVERGTRRALRRRRRVGSVG